MHNRGLCSSNSQLQNLEINYGTIKSLDILIKLKITDHSRKKKKVCDFDMEKIKFLK